MTNSYLGVLCAFAVKISRGFGIVRQSKIQNQKSKIQNRIHGWLLRII